MSTPKYPNRDALREANDIYLDAMRPFVVHHLKQVQGEAVEYLIEETLADKQVDKFWKILDETGDVKSAIDFSYFPLIIRDHWRHVFAQRFNNDMIVQSMLWLIRDGRNSCEHRGTKDLDFEFVRTNLFLIADVLGKINRPDEQREVESIRDDLFSDDTAECLAEAEERLKTVEAENAKYEKSLAQTKKNLEAAESEKSGHEENNAALSKQVDEKENRLKKLSRQLKRAKTENDKSKKNLAGAKQNLKKSEAARADYKKCLETTSKELKGTEAERDAAVERLTTELNKLAAVQAEKNVSEERLTAVQNLLATVTIGHRKVQSVFPPLGTDSAVRILDRRNVGKKNYLLDLLEQKQPTIIYVQGEEKISQLLTNIVPEKADVIGKHDVQTSEAQETEMLDELASGKLIAIVSNGTISTTLKSHHVEHFVLCHLVPDLDLFFKQCQPVFTSAKDAYLHLIYNNNQDIKGLNEWLNQKYPDREALENLYRALRELVEIKGDFVKPENLYDELDMAKLGIETGLTIFEEVRLLEQNKNGIKLLPPSGKKLDESKVYDRGKKLKDGMEEVCAFQLEQSIEEIWEEILEKVDIDNERILRENNISIDLEEITVESLTESVEGISETAAGEFVTTLEPHGALSQAREPRLSIADRYVTETTEEDRDKLAVQIAARRINAMGSKPLAWKAIRAEFGLKNDQFHKVIRHSAGYRKAVIDRIKSLKAQEGGWEYSGKLGYLTGIDDISEDELK